MNVYHLPFLSHKEFILLPRPDKLLLIGLYHQWVNNNCLPLRINQVNMKMLFDLSGIKDLKLDALPERRWRYMHRCGLFLSDDTITFVTNPTNNSCINLAKSQLAKTDKGDQKCQSKVIKSVENEQKVSEKKQKQSEIGQKPYGKKSRNSVIKSEKPRLHPNFTARMPQHSNADKNVKK